MWPLAALSLAQTDVLTAQSTCGALKLLYTDGACCGADADTSVSISFPYTGPPLSPPVGSPPSAAPPFGAPPSVTFFPPPPGVSPPTWPPYIAPPSAPISVPGSTYADCETSIGGAGTGGLYTAWRMVFDAGYNGSKICIFEADTRLGGRIYSLRNQGAKGDLTIDAGGYRTFDTISPRSQYLITQR